MDEESERIARVLAAARTPIPPGVRGPGDDCAVLPWADATDLVLTTDAVAEGVHFWDISAARDVGRYAAAVNLSDIAAAGATPKGFLLAAAMPREAEPGWLDEVAAGAGDMLRAHNVPLVGGDTKEAATRMLVGTAVGAVPRGTALGRGGARPGDLLAVTGPLGGPGAWLHRLARRDVDVESVSRAVLDVRPRLAHGTALRDGGAHAMTDLSDGLARAATLVAAASDVELVLDLDALPVSPLVADALGAHATPTAAPWREVVLAKGGEFELFAAVPADGFEALAARLAGLGLPLHAVGAVRPGSGVQLVHDGRTTPLSLTGWTHFSPAHG